MMADSPYKVKSLAISVSVEIWSNKQKHKLQMNTYIIVDSNKVLSAFMCLSTELYALHFTIPTPTKASSN